MSEFSNHNNEGTPPQAEQWEEIAEQIASHSTVDSKGNVAYLGRDVHPSERAKVEEHGFEKPGEPPRGSDNDYIISRDTYPQQPGESDDDYADRLALMRQELFRDSFGDHFTDVAKASIQAGIDHRQGKISEAEYDQAIRERNRLLDDDLRYPRNMSESQALEIAEQIASHSTVDGKGNVVYLGRDIHPSERAKVEERGFEKPSEPARGSGTDYTISEEAYPIQPGESDIDYKARLARMMVETHRKSFDNEGDADTAKSYVQAWADYKQDRISSDEFEKILEETKSKLDPEDFAALEQLLHSEEE